MFLLNSELITACSALTDRWENLVPDCSLIYFIHLEIINISSPINQEYMITVTEPINTHCVSSIKWKILNGHMFQGIYFAYVEGF